MERPRFFISIENKNNDIVTITGDEFTHLSSVLRLRVGEKIDVCFNDGVVHLCELIEINKKQALAEILSSQKIESRSSKIILFLALTKAERMDWAVQKCTELGIDEIVPFASEFCTVKDKGNKVERLNRVALSASKQSGRAVLPIISQNLSFNQAIEKLSQIPQVLLAYENASQNAKDVISKFDNTKDTAIIIGSEGGFAENEVKAFSNIGASVVSLGNNILRAETACVALLSAVNYQFDFWERK